MGWISKRVMELIIALAIGVLVFQKISHDQHVQNENEAYKKALQHLYDVVLRKHGPSDFELYQNVIHYAQKQEERSSEPSLSNLMHEMDSFQAFTIVPETPDNILELVDKAEEYFEPVEKAIEAGPLLPPQLTGDENWKGKSQLHKINSIANSLYYVAMKNWTHGEKKKAVRQLGTILKLGMAFQYLPDTQLQLRGIQIRNKALDGFEVLSWTNPSPEINREILHELNQAAPHDWSYPFSHVLRLHDTLEIGQDRGISNDYLSLAHVMLMNYRSKGSSFVDELERIGLAPSKSYSLPSISLRLGQWTFLPAMEKRFKALSEVFYESDLYFMEEDIKKFPLPVYIYSRLGSVNATEFIHNKNRAVLYHEGYRYRRDHDMLGKWPDAEYYKSWPVHSSNETEFFYIYKRIGVAYENINPFWPLVNQFIQFNIRNWNYSQWAYAKRYTPKDNYIVDKNKLFPYEPSEHLEQIDLIQYNVIKNMDQFTYYEKDLEQILNETNKKVRWIKGIFEQYKPMVNKVEIVYKDIAAKRILENNLSVYESLDHFPAYINVYLSQPDMMYWTVHRGMDRLWQGIFHPYNKNSGSRDLLFYTGWSGVEEEIEVSDDKDKEESKFHQW